MDKDVFLWNVYVNTDSMESLEAHFYRTYYKYREMCNNAKKKGLKNFRDTKQYIALLEELNSSHEKIHNCVNEEKNAYGEYNYPKVAYKRKIEKQNGKEVFKIYACVKNSNCSKKISIEHIFNFIPLYLDGIFKAVPSTFKNNNNIENSNIERVILESPVRDVVYSFKKYSESLKEFCDFNKCHELVSSLSDFPVNSISEIDFNSLMSKKEINSFIEEFKDLIKSSESVK